jgi:putative restriction endonuclease
MWSRKLRPYNELQPGDTLFWYEAPTRRIVWRSKVTYVGRFPYKRKSEVIRTLGLTTEQAGQAYFVNAPDTGFCLSYKVKALDRMDLPKSDDFRFPQQGWLRVDDDLARRWPGLPRVGQRKEETRRTARYERPAPAPMTNQLENARKTWSILTNRAKARSTITYSELGKLLNMHPRPLRFVLAPIQDYCLAQRLPPLTILVLNQRGRPGSGFIAWDPDHFHKGLDEVFSFHWEDQQNPFGFASEIESYSEFLDNLLRKPDTAADDAYAKVKIRGAAQIIFRDLLLRAYDKRCAFSGCGFTDALEAAHIVPWSSCTRKDRLDVRNGLLLTSVHHTLFDHGILTLTPDRRIVYCPPKRPPKKPEEFDYLITTNLNLTKMRLPARAIHYPAAKFIIVHNKLLELDEHLSAVTALQAPLRAESQK